MCRRFWPSRSQRDGDNRVTFGPSAGLSPLFPPADDFQDGVVAEYAELLFRALEEERPQGVLGGALLEDLVAAGAALRSTRVTTGDPGVGRGLSLVLAYDKALIRLCRAMSISIEKDRFSSPMAERSRLEAELSDIGPNWRVFIASTSPVVPQAA